MIPFHSPVDPMVHRNCLNRCDLFNQKLCTIDDGNSYTTVPAPRREVGGGTAEEQGGNG